MLRFFGSVFAACLLAIWTSTTVLAANPDWPRSLLIGTSAPGGIFIIYGEALSQLLSEKLGIAVNITPTHGTPHNLELMERGDAQLGPVLMGGWGTGDWNRGRRFQTIRALVPMYETPFHTVALRRSGITTLVELDKKRIGVGPRAGLTAAYAQRIFAALGIPATMQYGSFDTMAAELLEGDTDATFVVIAAPAPAIRNVEAKEPVTFISASPEQIDIIRNAIPELIPSKIAAGTYRFLDKDFVTVGLYNFVVGRADLPDDLVYQLVKAVFENQPRLVKATSAASETVPQNAVKDTFLSFHPGAVRYYREVGVKIPDELAPLN